MQKKNINFIYSFCFGLTGGIFTDFGPNHIIIDPDGKESKSYYINSITKDGLVTIDNIQNTEKLDLGDGDFVKFKNIEGMIELNNKEFKIKEVKDTESFIIEEDISKFGDYIKGGIVCEIKKPKIIKYEDYRKRSEIMWDSNSKLYCCDFSKSGSQLLLFNS